MTYIEFREWPKITRLNRPMIVTEKIDGTNAAVIVHPLFADERRAAGSIVVGRGGSKGGMEGIVVHAFGNENNQYLVGAQSRKKLISPGKQDNAGFAGWVREHAQELAEGLGEGYHYGEWWGKGIQRGYGLDHKRFSLFNVTRWRDERPSCCHVVPTLYEGIFDTDEINFQTSALLDDGSHAAPGWNRPEGVVAFHVPSGRSYKVLCENDELPKGVVEGSR
jgi:RNA ligase